MSSVISCVSTGFMPGRRLVEQEDARLRRRRASDLEPAAVRVREAVGRLVPAVAHQPLAEEGELLLGELVRLALLAASPRETEHRLDERRARAAVRRGHDVLLDAHVQEQPERLERARDAAVRDLVRREPDDALAVEQDVAGVGLVDAGDEVEERRLAGAVRADDAHDLALVHLQVQIVDALEPAERLAHPLELEQASAIRRSPPVPAPGAPADARPLRR